MRRPLTIWLVALAVGLAACSDTPGEATSSSTAPIITATGPPPTTASTTSSVPATDAPTAPTEAATPPPASFDELADDFAATRDPILEPGRLARDQFLANDLEALYARFDRGLADLVSLEDLEAGRSQLEADGSLMATASDRAIQLGLGLRLYAAEVEWGDGYLTLNASFDEAGAISGLFLSPQPAQPPDPAGDYTSAVSYQLPFEGTWFTFWGGDTAIQNYHVVAAVQRHAFDFVIWKDGGTHSGDGTAVDNYWAYGQRVVAPAAGTVVTVVDGLADQVPQTGSDTANPAGNHVIIETAEGEYLLIAHLQEGSLPVAPGDSVQAGQLIGLVGNSGTTTEPHIHIHVQDDPVFSLAAGGLPLVFTNYLANGDAVEQDQPLGDQFVSNR